MPNKPWTPPDYAKQDTWSPPDYAQIDTPKPKTPAPTQPESSVFGDIWDYINKPITDAPSRAASHVANPLMKYGELGTDLPHKAALYGGAFTQSLSDVVSSLTSPLNLGLTAVSGGSNLAAKTAATSENFANKTLLMQIAKALETPGRAAGMGMVGQGLYNASDSEKPTDERLAGLVESILGGHNLRSRVTVPKMDILPAEPPSTALATRGPTEIGPSIPTEPVAPAPIVSKLPSLTPKYTEKDTIFGKERKYTGLPETQVDTEEGWKPPEYSAGIAPQEPEFARTKQGVKIGADVGSLGRVLGSSLYGGDIVRVSAKELLQNSMDAVRHLEEGGDIHVTLDRDNRFVEVKDNGAGLTKKELETVFTDLGSSGKRDDVNAVGGFGLAKAAPLLGGERVEVTTVAKEKDGTYLHSFKGTPEDLLAGVNMTSYKVADNTPTGTTVRTMVPPDSSFYGGRETVTKIAKHSPGFRGKITVNNEYGETKTHVPSKEFEDATTETLSSPTADVDIIVPKGTPYGPSYGVPVQLANNGMYQGTTTVGNGEYPGIPATVIVNVRSKVPEGHRDYPFTANREMLRGPVQEQIEKHLKDTLVAPAIGRRFNQLNQVWQGMPEVELPTQGGSTKFHVYDVGQKFTPDELSQILGNSSLIDLATHISDGISDIVASSGKQNWIKKLDRIGLIFDEQVHGIHIPKPGENKSAILINPFEVMRNNPPDAAALHLSHTMMHEVAHIEGGGHDEGFTTRLSELYKTIGRRSIRRIEDNIYDAITGGNQGQYSPKLQGILQQYIEARGRTTTTEDPLRGTGISSENIKPDRKNKVPVDVAASQQRAFAQSVEKLKEAIKLGLVARQTQDKLYSIERSRRAGMIDGVTTPGVKGYYEQLGLLGGELPKIPSGSKLSQKDVDMLIDGVTNSELKSYQQINAKTGLLKLMSGKAPQMSEVKLLNKVFGDDFGELIMLHGGLGAVPVKDIVSNVVNVPKSIMASMDLSAPLRQGLPLITKGEYWNSFDQMFKMAGSDRAFQDLQTSLLERPKFQVGEDAGLFLAGVGDSLTSREEAFLSPIAEKIPVIGSLIKGSERAYVGFLNKLRADVFDNLVDEAKDAGHPILNEDGDGPSPVVHEIARFVNTATGRGSLGRFEKNAVDFNTVFFSPRMISSRLTMLNPKYYVDAHPFVRKQALKALLSVAAAGLAVAALSKRAGATINDNPTSSDFGKAKFGNTRLDPYGGFQQYIVAANRLITGRTTSAQGNTSDLGKGVMPSRLGMAVGIGNKYNPSFMENKFSPVASFIDDLTSGRTFPSGGTGGLIAEKRGLKGGEARVTAEVINRYTPMILSDLVDIYKDNPNLLPLGILGAFGMGLQTFGPKNIPPSINQDQPQGAQP